MANEALAPIDGRSFATAQAFILSVKSYWTREIYPELRAEYERKAGLRETPPASAADVGDLLKDSTLYQYYAWLERHLQRFKYSGRYGLQPYLAQDRERLEASLSVDDLPDGLLELDPGFEVPKYFASVDIHQHPGGIYADEIAGYVYERGARSTTPLATRHKDLHERLAGWIEENGGAPERLLDMGCGFGKSTRPLYETFRDCEVVGVDIAAPCLKLAAHDAADAQARNVRFLQKDATDTGLDGESFDVVTSTMFLHEITPPAIRACFDETYRLLSPGGRMVHLDFYHFDDVFTRFIHYTHGRRNNEPYMEPWAEMDAVAELEERGFRNVRVMPFEEADGTLDPAYRNWRFPWTLIVAEK